MLRLFVLALCLWAGSAHAATIVDPYWKYGVSVSGNVGGGHTPNAFGVSGPIWYHLPNLEPDIYFDSDYTPVIAPDGGFALTGSVFEYDHKFQPTGGRMTFLIDRTWVCTDCTHSITHGTYVVNHIPLPPGMPLFATALAGLGLWRSRARTT